MSAFLAIVNNAAMNICVYKFVLSSCFKNFLDIYLKVELLSHLAVLCLTFRGTTKLFSTTAVTFYITLVYTLPLYITSNIQGFQFLHIIVKTYFLLY